MPTAYTSLLGLALPVTGELSGTWGDTVNDYITKYLDSSVAGTQTISGSQTAVTLTRANGGALSPVGSGSTGSSQYQIINCTGNPAGTLTITVDVSTGTYALSNSTYSQTFAVINATSTSQSVVVRATTTSGTSTGVTMVSGERAIIAWNGSDFIKVATSAVDGVSTIAFGTTGLTPSSATSGAVTVAGTLVAANGGTGQSTYTTGDLLYATGSTALSKLGIGTNGQILTSTGTAPQWSTLSGVAVTTFSAGTTGFTPSSATSGAVTLAGTLATTNGGTGLTSFTANGVVYASSTSALTTGSALTFDGTTFAVNSAASIGASTAKTKFYSDSIYNGIFNGASLGSNESIYMGGGMQFFFASGSEQMRLTSTGLGIGTSSPTLKLDVNGSAKFAGNYVSFGDNGYIRTDAANVLRFQPGSGGYEFRNQGNSSNLAVLDSSGNLGLGVTPSAWSTAAQTALQVYTAGVSGNGGGNTASRFTHGCYLDGSTWKYQYTGVGPARYEITGPNAGSTHSWSIAAGGTAGNAISFTQAMTLDASGNLMVGTTSQVGRFTLENAATTTEITLRSTGGIGINNRARIIGGYEAGGSDYGGYLAFNTTSTSNVNTERARIDASGNLGVGTTSPSGNGRLELNVPSGNNTNLTFYENGASRWLIGSVTGSNAFRFYDLANATERFQIAATGAWGLAGANYGTSGQVLTSNGSGSAPTWQNAGGGGGSAATPTALGTVYGKTDTSSLAFLGYQAGNSNTGTGNTAVGYQAAYSNTTGEYLEAFGYSALRLNTTGVRNSAFGTSALYSNTTGNYNVAVGFNTLQANTTASSSTAVGYQALYSGTTGGAQAVAVGYQAGYNNNALYFTALGYQAGYSNTSGATTVAIGYQALYSNTTGTDNLAIGGYQTLYANTTGANNTAVGRQALASNTTASNNTAVGYQALYSNTTTDRNIAIGHQAGYFNTAAKNLFIGYQAGYSNTTGTGNSFVGGSDSNNWPPGYYNTTGSDNTAFGGGALRANTTGVRNTAIGTDAVHLNTTGEHNTAIGYQAAYSSTGGYNTVVGYQAGYSNTTGYVNALGYRALYNNTTATVNTAVGAQALFYTTTGDYNTAVGRDALLSNTTANDNTAVGYQAAYSTTTGVDNTAIGYQSLYSHTTGYNNTCIGQLSGYSLTTGYRNTFVGASAGYGGFGAGSFTTGTYNISIGFATGASSGIRNNSIVIGTPYAVVDKGENTGFINPNSGGVYQGNNSSSWSTTSDFRLKKNIVDNNEGLEKITAIKVRNFEYRLPEEVTELPEHTAIKKAGVQLGVIAQELQQVCPDCVKEESTGVLSVDSDNVFWHMVNAIKQLNAKVEALQAEITTLKGA